MRSAPSWDEWAREPTDFEQTMAARLLDLEPGSEIVLNIGYKDAIADVEVRYVDDRPAVRELRCSNDLSFWVIREKYVFCLGADGTPIFLDWEGAEDPRAYEEGIVWEIDGETIAPEGVLKA